MNDLEAFRTIAGFVADAIGYDPEFSQLTIKINTAHLSAEGLVKYNKEKGIFKFLYLESDKKKTLNLMKLVGKPALLGTMTGIIAFDHTDSEGLRWFRLVKE